MIGPTLVPAYPITAQESDYVGESVSSRKSKLMIFSASSRLAYNLVLMQIFKNMLLLKDRVQYE